MHVLKSQDMSNIDFTHVIALISQVESAILLEPEIFVETMKNRRLMILRPTMMHFEVITDVP